MGVRCLDCRALTIDRSGSAVDYQRLHCGGNLPAEPLSYLCFNSGFHTPATAPSPVLYAYD